MNSKPDDIGEMIEITLVGEDGEEMLFEHVLTFMYEDQRYMALIPAEQANEEEAELVFMHIEPDKAKGDVYSVVDNEVLCEELFEVFVDLIDEIENDKLENVREGEVLIDD